MTQRLTVCLLLASSIAVPHVAHAAEPAEESKPIDVRVELGGTRRIELRPRTAIRNGKVVRKILNRKGEFIYAATYELKDGELINVTMVAGEKVDQDSAAEVRFGPDPDSVTIIGREVGTTTYTVVGDKEQKHTFRILTCRGVSLLMGRSFRLQMAPPRRLKGVVAGNPHVMSGGVCPKDRTYAVINALRAGRTPFGLIAEDGTRQTVDLSVMKVDPDQKSIVLASGESISWSMTNNPDLRSVVNENDMVIEVRATPRPSMVRITARNPGITYLTMTSADRKTEDFQVVVTEPRQYVFLGRTARIQVALHQPIKAITTTDPKCLEVGIDPKDATTATIHGLQDGDTQVTITAEDGGKDVFEYRVYSDKPKKDRIVLPRYATQKLTLPDGEQISSVECSAEHIVSSRLLEQTRIIGLIPGVARVTIEGRRSRVEKEVVVIEPKGKETPEKKPLRVEEGERFRWKDLDRKNFGEFLIEDQRIVRLDDFRDEDPLMFTAHAPGRTKILFIRDDEGNRDVVDVIVTPKK